MATVTLAVSASIAAYKIPELVRLLRKDRCDVTVLLTEKAALFVTPLSLEVVSERPVITTGHYFSNGITHLEAAKSDLFVIAPATADIISKCALGLADDVVTASFLACRGQKLIVPAMHSEMYLNPVIQGHIASLKAAGAAILGPDSGDLACGDSGVGRMVSPELIALRVKAAQYALPDLTGQRVVVTAGGTRERIDPVRVISNLSTGRLGHEIAHMAAFAGADVTLITTNSEDSLVKGPHIRRRQVVSSAAEMKTAVHDAVDRADILFMAAAVSDFTPVSSARKLKRHEKPELVLQPTEDILASLKEKDHHCFIVGFCLENEDVLMESARQKLATKGIPMIVANSPADIGQSRRSATLLSANSDEVVSLRDMDMTELAGTLLICQQRFSGKL